MSVIKSVILEEHARLLEVVAEYDKKISQFPKGSIIRKQRGLKYYCYLSYREQGKVRSDYIGSEDSQDVLELTRKIEQRRRYERLRKEALQNLKDMKELIRAALR